MRLKRIFSLSMPLHTSLIESDREDLFMQKVADDNIMSSQQKDSNNARIIETSKRNLQILKL